MRNKKIQGEVVIKETAKNDDKITVEIPQEKPRKNKKGLIKFILFMTFILLLIGGGIAIGVICYPRAYQWLVDHSFIEVTESNGETTTNWNWDDSVTSQIVYEESAIINVVQTTQDSVVSIAVDQVTMTPDGTTDTSSNIGTGFIVDSNGLILTNQHVVSDAQATYKVIDSDGNAYAVENILTDDFNDLALIKVNATNLKPVTFGDSDNLVAGQLVIAIGTPLGTYAGSVTTGVISGLNRSITASSGFLGSTKSYENVIQTDAAINSGNSGGPLLNSSGEVIGINFATTQGADNISFALPIDVAKSRLEEYRVYGKFMKPYIGVQYQPISEAEAQYYSNVVAGAYIIRVIEGSPAATAGIKKGDFITRINSESVGTSLIALIQKYDVGEEITVTIWRNGETLDLKVTLGESD